MKSFSMISAVATLLLIISTDSSAKHTVSGVITDKNGNPAVGVRVRLFDSDTIEDQEMMPPVFTDAVGHYKFDYKNKHWDDAPAPDIITTWRPDIYIKVSAPVKGRCDEGEWNADANWEYLDQSRVFSNHHMSQDLIINMKLKEYPRNIMSETFIRGQNMWSEVDFFFHYSAFGCARNGDKVSWTGYGFGNPPIQQERCWVPPNPKCSTEDEERIKELGRHPVPADPERPGPGNR